MSALTQMPNGGAFTPGPWQATGQSSHGTYFKIRGTRLGQKWKVADLPFNPECPGEREEAEANARLISAAPELLNALLAERLVNVFEDPWRSASAADLIKQMHALGYESAGHEGELPMEFVARLKSTAIAKALGTAARSTSNKSQDSNHELDRSCHHLHLGLRDHRSLRDQGHKQLVRVSRFDHALHRHWLLDTSRKMNALNSRHFLSSEEAVSLVPDRLMSEAERLGAEYQGVYPNEQQTPCHCFIYRGQFLQVPCGLTAPVSRLRDLVADVDRDPSQF